MCVTDMLSGR